MKFVCTTALVKDKSNLKSFFDFSTESEIQIQTTTNRNAN
jgi:hypothetical protein